MIRWSSVIAVAGMLWLSPGSAAHAGTQVLWYWGNGGLGDRNTTVLCSEMTAAGATSCGVGDVWPTRLSDYRVIFLALSTTTFSASQISDIQAYLTSGGVVVLVGESYSFRSGNPAVFNSLLSALGATTRFGSSSLDSGCPPNKTGTVVASHPLVSGVATTQYAWSNTLTLGAGGTLLIRGISRQAILAVEDPRGSLVIATDSGMFAEGTTGTCLIPAAPGNRQLMRNLYAAGAGCSTGAECPSGFCVDSVCCDTACGGGATDDCLACSVSAGASVEGVCGTVTGTVAASTVCRASAGPCDVEETCSGSSPTCPADVLVTEGTVCRSVADLCDVDEVCGGSSATCPVDGLSAAGTVCRPVAGTCDRPETCTGASRVCPADFALPAGTACRPADGPCDVGESCDGSTVTCPSDRFAADGTSCSDGMMCNGAETCISGTCAAGTPVECDDMNPCTSDACAESAGCAFTPVDGCCMADLDCDDGNPCTDDRCVASACIADMIPDCFFDAGQPDAGPSAVDGGGASEDAGPSPRSRGARRGCACTVPGASPAQDGRPALLIIVAFAIAALRRRRRAAAQRP